MKWLPPLVAMLVIGVPVGTTVFEARKTERENRILEHRIREAEDLSPREVPEPMPEQERKPVVGADGVDWKRVLEASRRGPGGLPDVRTLMEFTRHLRELDEAGWRRLLDDIDGLGLSPRERDVLDGILIGPLTGVDPRLAFERYSDQLSGRGGAVSWHLGNAFDRWLQSEPEEAVTWYREALAAGVFESTSLDGRNGSRTAFDSTLVRHWLQDGDAGTAEEYLSELPEDRRVEILQRPGRVIPNEHQRAFAELVRAQLSPQASAAVLATEIGSHAGRTDLERVSRAMDRISATTDERERIAERAADDFLRSDGFLEHVDLAAVTSTRGWLRKEVPDEADRITGRVLGGPAADELAFENRVTALQFLLDRGAGQEMLVGFLDGQGSQRYRAGMGRLLERVADPAERERLGERLGIGTTAEVGR